MEWSLVAGHKGDLVAELLGLNMDKIEIRPQEQAPVDRLYSECMADLKRQLGQFNQSDIAAGVEAEAEAAEYGEYSAAIVNEDGNQLAHLRWSRSLLVAWTLGDIASSGGDELLAPRREALQQQKLHLGCKIGQCRVTLADMKALAPGDILILDRGLDDKVDALIADRTFAPACGTLDRDGDNYRLTLTA